MLVSLREVAEEFREGKIMLSTDLEMRIGDAVTPWSLRFFTNVNDANYGTLGNHAYLFRAGGPLGRPNWHPDLLQARGLRDVEVVSEVYGVDLDTRVWTKGSNPHWSQPRHERSANGQS